MTNANVLGGGFLFLVIWNIAMVSLSMSTANVNPGTALGLFDLITVYFSNVEIVGIQWIVNTFIGIVVIRAASGALAS